MKGIVNDYLLKFNIQKGVPAGRESGSAGENKMEMKYPHLYDRSGLVIPFPQQDFCFTPQAYERRRTASRSGVVLTMKERQGGVASVSVGDCIVHTKTASPTPSRFTSTIR
jgi:hypothetical protein